jgi:hypothetical protein
VPRLGREQRAGRETSLPTVGTVGKLLDPGLVPLEEPRLDLTGNEGGFVVRCAGAGADAQKEQEDPEPCG